jgi:hypothetical protein
MTCSSCKRFHDQGEWPDGERWCRVELRKTGETLYVCPSCCSCGGKKACTPMQIFAVAFLVVGDLDAA